MKRSVAALGLSLFVAASAAGSGLVAMSVSRQRLLEVASLDPVTLDEIGSVGVFVQDIAYRAADGFLYGYEFQVEQRLLRIDPATAATTPIGPPITDMGFANVHGMAYDPCADRFYATMANMLDLLWIDPATGAAASVGVMPARAWGLAYVPEDAALYGVTVFSDSLVRIDPADASFEVIGEAGAIPNVEGLAYNAKDGFLYAVLIDPAVYADSVLARIDRVSGVVTPIGPIGTDDFVSGLAWIDPCPTDLDGDGETGFQDLLALLFAWGPCPRGPGGPGCAVCAEDFDGDGAVGFGDLLELLFRWGACA